MCELYACSSVDPICPREDFDILRLHGAPAFGNEAGWGLSWEIGGQEAILKEAESPLNSSAYKGATTSAPDSCDWIVHLRAASKGGVCMENTQPYLFGLGQEQAIFAHNGDLPDIDKHPEFIAHAEERRGNADSECAMIILRHRFLKAANISEMWSIFEAFSVEMQKIGPANFLVRAQGNLFVHSDRRKPVGSDELQTPGLTMLISDSEIRISSEPLSDAYKNLRRGECLWIKSGRIIERS